jgi:uncharacterized protein
MQTLSKNISIIASKLSVSVRQIEAVVSLLDEGATVPFIARYRKEVTGSLDEVAITSIRDRILSLRELDKRRETVLKSIEEQGKLTPELQAKIEAAQTLSELEDLYLPYKPKRRTRATIAREKGLEPLAFAILTREKNLNVLAGDFVSTEKSVASAEEALAGARDILAEWINENSKIRAAMRQIFENTAEFVCKVMEGKEEAAQKYRDYFDWRESVKTAPSHRVLAMRRGENEGFLSLSILPEEDQTLEALQEMALKMPPPESFSFDPNLFMSLVSSPNAEAEDQIRLAAQDSYKRLLRPSMETEIRLWSKQKADEEAIRVFAQNVRQLLMAAPLGQKSTLAIDPGFRTGCKVVCLDPQGKLLHDDVIYPHSGSTHSVEEAANKIKKMVQAFDIESIAIGNGTAGRETETFIKSLKLNLTVVMVNESGASVYSASEVAREEFPDKDLTVRGAVSIGRRLMDPLAELVKIDPKSIGVGQYQHDVDQNQLKQSLDDTVVSSVNAVGVEVNTASKELLSYVSGLNSSVAKNIVKYREQNGAFEQRESLKKVPRLGDKAFEQAAGFLRIRGAKNPLDESAVHPESYHIVEKMAKDLGCEVVDLIKNDELRKKIKLSDYISDKIGLPTLQDIIKELAKPGRDPREKFETFEFASGIEKPEDLRVGMELPGIVTNITNFGAFVDIGVHQDGLLHLSQISDRFIKHPSEVLSLQQKIKVRVLEVDLQRKRINLSMKGQSPGPKQSPKPQSEAERLQALKEKFGK